MANNLVKNAIVHNRKGGHIDVLFESNAVIISNTGSPVSKNTDLFERYASGSTDKKSSGLGLAIVKSIANQYAMRITHRYDDGIHTVILKTTVRR